MAAGLGAIAIAVSMYIMFLIMRPNSFAAPVMKIQAERGHRVISDGPLRDLRHPMYGGALLLIVGIPLLLGSWWGLVLSPVIILLLAVRAVMEERTLMAELPGYTNMPRVCGTGWFRWCGRHKRNVQSPCPS